MRIPFLSKSNSERGERQRRPSWRPWRRSSSERSSSRVSESSWGQPYAEGGSSDSEKESARSRSYSSHASGSDSDNESGRRPSRRSSRSEYQDPQDGPPPESTTHRDSDEDWNPLGGIFALMCTMTDGSLFGCKCGGICGISILLLGAVWIGVTRNLYCNPESLRGAVPPFGGDLIPANFSFVERKYYFQFTKLVDVYSENMTWVGYFYDINLWVIMRFGFSDTQHRIWFEARYASLFSRFKPWIEYDLQRCDSGDGKASEIYQLREAWFEELIARFYHDLCIVNCVRYFDIAKRKTDMHMMEGLVPPVDFAEDPILRITFDSTINPVFSLSGGPRARHAWRMKARRGPHGALVAFAQERFFFGDFWNHFSVLSHWYGLLNTTDKIVPNWVLAYMAVLDNVEEG